MKAEEATLLDVLVDGFEKNEITDGFHWRDLPLPDEAAAVRTFLRFAEEATRWKGEPQRVETTGPRRVVAWADLEVRQAGRGVMVRVRAPWFDAWWHAAETWEGGPFEAIWDWLKEERG